MREGFSPLIIIIVIVAAAILIAGLASYGISANLVKQSASVCRTANVVIQGGSFDASSGTLRLVVYNTGKLSMTFDATVARKDGTPFNTGTPFTINAGESREVMISNVNKDMTTVSIQSRECPNIGDYLKSAYIKGIGY